MKNQDITWKVVACAACAVLWALLFWKMTQMSNKEDELAQDMAIVLNVLHIDRAVGQRHSNNHTDQTQTYEKYIQ